MRVEVGVGCVGKFNELSIMLWSLMCQTYTDWDLTIIDETINHPNYPDVTGVGHILKIMEEKGHQWRIFYGEAKGFHFAQTIVLNTSRHPLTWILGEDVAFEPNCMAELVKQFEDSKVGIVSGLLFLAGDKFRTTLPDFWNEIKEYSGKIHFVEGSIGYGNQVQYSIHLDESPKEVEHLIGNMMYRTELGRRWGFNLDLSYAARTADNDFSYQFYLAGYKVLVVPTSVTWHLETHQYGGLKKSSEEYSKLCNDDRRKFEERLLRWGKISTRFNV